MSALAVDDAAKVLANPAAYTDEAQLHAALTHLRGQAPVAFVEASGYRPFYAITRHADIMAVERANDLFINAPRPVLMPAEQEDLQAAHGVRTLIHMDDPQHRAVRAIAVDWFRPKAMRALKTRIDELAKIYVDKMCDAGGQCDFVQDIAVNYPLFVIMSLLGVPEADFPRMLKLTQELVGNEDSEFQRSATPEERAYALLDMFEYFTALTAARRAQPTEDLGSTIANARIDGEPLSDIDTVSYYVIIATAGHDTTSATISGGVRALIEHPDQRKRLCNNMSLMQLATEEMIRRVTPVKAFMRTATADTEVGGVPICAGDSVLLSYVSANRDEDVFDEPFCFDVCRDRTSISRSATAFISAWVRRWPVWRSTLLHRTTAAAGNGRLERHAAVDRHHVRRRPQTPSDPVLDAMSKHLRIDDHNGIRVLTIDRPESKNALHGPLRAELCAAAVAADRDDTVRVVVLTAVDPVFSAGVDFKQLERGPGETGSPSDINPASAIRAVGKAVICAVNGGCVSGALEIALSCSFVVASEHARFADTHAMLGVVPTWGLTALLPRAVGIRKAREMSITGEFVHAAEALRIGLVNHVVSHDDLLRFTLELAERVPPHAAVGEMLDLYARGEDLSLTGALAAETTLGMGRTYDLEAFTAAGNATAARQREGRA